MSKQTVSPLAWQPGGYTPPASPRAGGPPSPHTQKQFEVLAAIRSNLEESDVEGGIKARMLGLLDELDLHLGLSTFTAKQTALVAFASAHLAVLFPVVGPLIETLGDPS